MTTSLKRSKLYDYLWSLGLSKTAIKLNSTTVKIKTAAKDANIPLPDNTYWGNLQAGNNPERIAIPNPENDKDVIIQEKVKHSQMKNYTDNTKIKSEILNDNDAFPNIELSNKDAVNTALKNIKIPKNMPKKAEPLINDVISEFTREKNNRYGLPYVLFR